MPRKFVASAEFRELLEKIGMTPTEYARVVGSSATGVYQRSRAERGTPAEVLVLLRALSGYRTAAERLREAGGG